MQAYQVKLGSLEKELPFDGLFETQYYERAHQESLTTGGYDFDLTAGLRPLAPGGFDRLPPALGGDSAISAWSILPSCRARASLPSRLSGAR
jgi:hypothetical protein